MRENWTQNAVSSGVFSMKSSGMSVMVRNLRRGRRGGAARTAKGSDLSTEAVFGKEQIWNKTRGRDCGDRAAKR